MKPSERIKKIADKNNVFLREDWKDNHTREFQWIRHILTYLDEQYEAEEIARKELIKNLKPM